MYLVAGLYEDAMKCYDDAAERCRGVGDMLWEAVAREGRAVTGVGQAWGLRDGSVSCSGSQYQASQPLMIQEYVNTLSSITHRR